MLLVFLSVFISLSVLCASPVSSSEDPKKQYQKLQKEIETQKEKIEKTKRLESSILEELDRMNRELADVQASLRKYRLRLKANESEIRKVDSEMTATKASLKTQTEWLKRKLRVMQRHGYSGDVIIMLSTANDISQLLRRWRYIKALTVYDHTMLESYKATLNTLSKQQDRLKTLHSELQENTEKIQESEKLISEKKNSKEILIASVRKEKSSSEKMLRELKETAKNLLEIIKRSEETTSYAAKGFHNLKGKLPWPVSGKVIVPYGAQRDPKFNTPVFRNGIHIRAEEDSTAKAVHQGKVVFADWFKGYGQLIIVNHGDGYHTLYANLTEIFCKVSDIIKEKQAIGVVGESGTLNSSGLYFEIRYKGKPLDPTQWLRRK